MTSCSTVIVDLSQIIKWAKRGDSAYIELLKDIALWQLSHIEEAKVLPYSDAALLTLLPFGIDKQGNLRLTDTFWLSAQELTKATGNPIIFNHILSLSNEGDDACREILANNRVKNKDICEKLKNEICYNSIPLNSIDENDINRVLNNCQEVFGIRLTFLNGSFPPCLLGFCDKEVIEKTRLSALCLYFEYAACVITDKINKDIQNILTRIVPAESEDDINLIIGLGHSKDVEPGFFRLTLIASYN